MSETTAAPETAPTKPKRKIGMGRPLIILGAAIVIGVAGVLWLQHAGTSVSTDNAYLKTDSTTVAPRVRGLIASVLVRDNETVQAGQPLVQLDPEEYATRVAAAEGDLAMADAAVASAEATFGKLGAEETLAASSSAEAQTAIRAADAQAARAQTDWKRYETLVGTGAVPRRDAERIRAEAISASADAERARAAYAVSQNQAAVTGKRRPELLAAVAQARASQAKARAALDLARQDRSYALISAPVAGVVADRQAQAGDYVQPGTRLLTLVPLGTLYASANFKETQTARMLPGQRAEVRIDAMPGKVFKATVDSIAPGSGSEFALLPFEPGTGNFTKIVQRIPVRLKFDADQPELKRLRPGLSAKIKVILSDG